jgi:hypothetical protein
VKVLPPIRRPKFRYSRCACQIFICGDAIAGNKAASDVRTARFVLLLYIGFKREASPLSKSAVWLSYGYCTKKQIIICTLINLGRVTLRL